MEKARPRQKGEDGKARPGLKERRGCACVVVGVCAGVAVKISLTNHNYKQ